MVELTKVTKISAELAFAEHKASQSEEEICKMSLRKQKLLIYKNVIVLSLGFLLLFTAFQSLSNLQSSLNSKGGLGTASLAVIYGSLVLSCLFVPSLAIRFLGLKITLVISMLLYGTYFAANLHAKWWTLIPTSVLLGLAGAPLWTAKCAYLSQLAGQYAALAGDRPDLVLASFFGVFFMVFQSGQVWGNLISYYILMPEYPSAINISTSLCGVSFCPLIEKQDFNTNLVRPEGSKVQLLAGTYTACALAAALLLLTCLESLPPRRQPPPGCQLLVETVRHLRHVDQLLLLPLTIFSGLEQAFLVGDFTQAYVACSRGVYSVGYVMICFGVCDALGSATFGSAVRRVGRIPVFILGALGNLTMMILMALGPADSLWLHMVVAGVWGLGDAVWQTQINALYGTLFPSEEEAAFANYRLWESVGFIIAFSYSTSLCTHIKLIILAVMLAVGMVGYGSIEWRERRKSSSSP